MCSQGQSVVKLYLPPLADRPSISQVTNTGQVCASVSGSLKAPLMSGTMYITKSCVCLSACARPAVWHSAVSGAKPRDNVQAQISEGTTVMSLHCPLWKLHLFCVCVCVAWFTRVDYTRGFPDSLL